MDALRPSLLVRCFLRTYLVAAAYNPRGLQNIGFTFAIEPALEALYGPGQALRSARMRYVRNYNCHPFWTPMLLGIFLHMENAIAEGRTDPGLLTNLKDTTANALSAIGDSLFNGTLLSTWALVTSCLVLAGMPVVAGVFTLLLFCLLQAFKMVTFVVGLRKGMAVLLSLRKLDLINWGDRFKCVNAVLLAVFLHLALPGVPVLAWGGVGLYLLLAGWIVGKIHIPRVFVALILLAIIVGLHLTGLFGEIPLFLHGVY